MHISSLPGKTGIGTLGKEAYKFVDFLKEAKQSYWQILPIGPTSYGDSPYQSFSTFAGNPYFIDFDILAEEGYLKKEDYENVLWCTDEKSVDYGLLYIERHKLFLKLQKNFKKKIPSDFKDFCARNDWWLENYALFMAIKDAHGGIEFTKWESDIARREKKAVEKWTEKCAERIEYYKMLQYFLFRQWYALKKYANDNGIKIIGDIPIYVSADSADVWASSGEFDLDENRVPHEVAGCPPDGFSADGQLWGNPVYNWDFQKKTGYSWWKKRLEISLKIYDILRIDHFRGFESYYCIPFGSENAKNGVWRKGPGADLFNSIKAEFGELAIIAEDLGFLTDDVRKMLFDVGFPGMKVLQFAFDSREENSYLPHTYTKNTVVCTGTHDNDTVNGWISSLSKEDLDYAKEYLRVSDVKKLREEMMICAIQSVSNTCILCMQDLLGLDGSARMNKPSTVGTNWKWRWTENQFTSDITEFLKYYTVLYQRCNS